MKSKKYIKLKTTVVRKRKVYQSKSKIININNNLKCIMPVLCIFCIKKRVKMMQCYSNKSTHYPCATIVTKYYFDILVTIVQQ